MTKHRVLVLESNSALTDRITQTLSKMSQIEICHEATVWGACRELAKRAYDLAIVPERDASWPADSFRAIQPTVPIVVTAISADEQRLAQLRNVYDGILRAEMVETDLPGIVDKLWAPSDRQTFNSQLALRRHAYKPTRRQLRSICNSIILVEGIKQALIFYDHKIIACPENGQFETNKLSEHIRNTWDDNAKTGQIQFVRLEEYSKPVLLYTKPTKDYLLTLVAEYEMPIDLVRHQADQFTNLLEPLEESGSEQTIRDVILADSKRLGNSYHLVWWPVERLPEALQMFIHQSIRRQARVNACAIQHLEVTSKFVYAIMICPPKRSSSWVAHLLKSGVEQEILARFGQKVTLWRRGYFAVDAQLPPTDFELNFILNTITADDKGD